MTVGRLFAYVDIEDHLGRKLGKGPIQNIVGFSITSRMDQAGEWSVELSSTDPQIDEVRELRRLAIYAQTGDKWTYIGGGKISNITRNLPDSGRPSTITVNGHDQIYDLSESRVSFDLSAQFNRVVTNALPSNWTHNTGYVPPHNDLYITAEYDNRLSILNQIAQRAQTHFRLDDRRTLYFTDTFEDSGVVAVDAESVLSEFNAAISDLKIETDTYCLCGAVRPLGSGNSGSALTMAASTRAVREGFDIDRANNILYSQHFRNEYEVEVGLIERVLEFNTVTQVSGQEIDLVQAANQLQAEAEYYLSMHDKPQEHYDIALTDCPILLKPLQTIKVEYTNALQNLHVDETLQVTETTWEGDSRGLRTTGLVASNVKMHKRDGSVTLAKRAQASEAYKVHRQRGPSIDNIRLDRPIDADLDAPFRFWLGDSVLQMVQAKARLFLEPLVSPVRATINNRVTSESGYGQETTSSNGGVSRSIGSAGAGSVSIGSAGSQSITSGSGGSANTGSSGGGSTGSAGDGSSGMSGEGSTGSAGGGSTGSGGDGATGSGGDGATGAGGTGATGSAGGGNTGSGGTGATGADGTGNTSTAAASATSGVTLTVPGGGSGSTSTQGSRTSGSPSSTTSVYSSATIRQVSAAGVPVVISNISFGRSDVGSGTHTHSVPSHSHTTNDHSHGPFTHSHAVSSHNHSGPSHTHSGPSHTHSVDSHTHSGPSHTHSGPSHTHSGPSHTHSVDAHTHSIPAHTHTVDAHIHSVSAHTHTVGTHTHSVQVSSHSHTGSIGSHSHTGSIGSHSHSFSISDHTHSVTINNHVHDVLTDVSLEYGIWDQTQTLLRWEDLEWSVNGSQYYRFEEGVFGYKIIEGDWIEIDITTLVQDNKTFRPTRSDNVMTVRRHEDGLDGLANVSVNLELRTIIQSVGLEQ